MLQRGAGGGGPRPGICVFFRPILTSYIAVPYFDYCTYYSWYPQPNLPARIFLLRLLTADDLATEAVQESIDGVLDRSSTV
eukprot:COSAG01_NODE_16674_length_1216_cov_1.214861_2_plen_80_part_01